MSFSLFVRQSVTTADFNRMHILVLSVHRRDTGFVVRVDVTFHVSLIVLDVKYVMLDSQ